MYADEDLLMLSGIQHFYFCKRQWSLIHIEKQWDENRLTVEGKHLHENVDNPLYLSKKAGMVTLRAVSLLSRELGLYGVADAVEMRPCKDSTDAIIHPKYEGKWNIASVEYKRGKRKGNICDELQLCAQTMCLEEMYGVSIPFGYLYYGEEKRRCEVPLDSDLRAEVYKCAAAMHAAFDDAITFPPVLNSKCKACSLFDICMPKCMAQKLSASSYLDTLKS